MNANLKKYKVFPSIVEADKESIITIITTRQTGGLH